MMMANIMMDYNSNNFTSNYDDHKKRTTTPEPSSKFHSDRKINHDSDNKPQHYGPVFSKAETSKPKSGANASSARRIKDMFSLISLPKGPSSNNSNNNNPPY